MREPEEPASAEELPCGQRQVSARVEDMTIELLAAAKPVAGNLGTRLDAQSWRLPAAKAEQTIHQVTFIRARRAGAGETARVDRVAENDRVDVGRLDQGVRTILGVVAEQVHVRSVLERLMTIPSRNHGQLVRIAGPQHREGLQTTSAVVIAIGVFESEGDQALLARRKTPPVVARGEIVDLGAEIKLRRSKQRALETERVSRCVARELVRDVAVDEGVIEPRMIEHRRREADGGRETVNRVEQVLAPAGTARQIRVVPALAQRDDEHVPAAAWFEADGVGRMFGRGAGRG